MSCSISAKLPESLEGLFVPNCRWLGDRAGLSGHADIMFISVDDKPLESLWLDLLLDDKMKEDEDSKSYLLGDSFLESFDSVPALPFLW